MPWYWPTSSAMQTWVSTTIASAAPTATTTATSLYNTTSSTGGTSIWAVNNNVWYQDINQQWQQAQQAALQQHLYQQQLQQQAMNATNERYVWQSLGLQPMVGRALEAISRPAIITHQEQQRRDEELYRRALAEHDDQEATRIRLQIEFRERTQQEQLRLQAEATQRNQEAQQQRQAADERARGLLLEHLSPEQRDAFTQRGWFIVQGGKSGRNYRIRGDSYSANVDVMHRDAVSHRLCAHVRAGRVPMGDQLLAQKMMLEYDEDAFLRVANRHG